MNKQIKAVDDTHPVIVFSKSIFPKVTQNKIIIMIFYFSHYLRQKQHFVRRTYKSNHIRGRSKTLQVDRQTRQ